VGNLLWGGSLFIFGFVRVDLVAGLFSYADAVDPSACLDADYFLGYSIR
jgi:hypothetical protein